MFVKFDRVGFVFNIYVKGNRKKKYFKGPKLGPLNCLNTSLCFSLTQILETKPALSYFTNILLATTKKTATYLFSVRKKNHRPNISQLHPTASEKKPLNCQQCQKISRKL